MTAPDGYIPPNEFSVEMSGEGDFGIESSSAWSVDCQHPTGALTVRINEAREIEVYVRSGSVRVKSQYARDGGVVVKADA